MIFCYLSANIIKQGGRVAEWSACSTHNLAVLGLCPALPLVGFVLGRHEFKPSVNFYALFGLFI